MKTIGLIGGLSWQSTIDYYRFMNLEVLKRTNGKHEAKIIIDSVDFGEVEAFMKEKDFEGIRAMMVKSAQRLEKAGADMVLIGANTMHFAAETVRAGINVPLVSIMEATIAAIRAKSLAKVGLLGTKITMEEDFFKQKLVDSGIDVLVPEKRDREFIHRTIFSELFTATIIPETKRRYLAIMDDLALNGAQGIILGCTEIPILIKQVDTVLPVFDTTEVHSFAAVELAMSG